jgi:hypothetical protein
LITFLPLVILLLILALMCFLLYYFYIQQSLETLSRQLVQLQTAKVNNLGADLIRREKAHHLDQLLLLEADLARYQREFLTDVERAAVGVAHQNIERCIAALKQSGDWLGLPFELEWSDMAARVPRVMALYLLPLAPAWWYEDAGFWAEDAQDVSKRSRANLLLRLA